MEEIEEFKEKAPSSARPKMKAKRPFVIHQNDVHIEINEGDDLSGVPEVFHENLKTEGVI